MAFGILNLKPGIDHSLWVRLFRALHAGLARKGCTKRYDKVLERLGRLKERYRQVAGQYDIAVERGSGQAMAVT